MEYLKKLKTILRIQRIIIVVFIILLWLFYDGDDRTAIVFVMVIWLELTVVRDEMRQYMIAVLDALESVSKKKHDQ